MEKKSIVWSIPERNRMQDQRRFQWLKAGELKRETESLMCVAQEQALSTNTIKNDIEDQDLPLYAGSAKRKLKVSPILSVHVLS